jgi:hypothetical protein
MISVSLVQRLGVKQPTDQFPESPSDLAIEIAEGWDKTPASGLLLSTGWLAHDETRTVSHDTAMSAVYGFQQSFFIDYPPVKLSAPGYFQNGIRSN